MRAVRLAGSLLLGWLALLRPALGDGLDLDAANARGAGRAGAIMVSEDSGAALLVNPGGLVRRDALRLELGMGIFDRDGTFAAASPPDAPVIRDQAGPASTPLVAAAGRVGPVVAGIGYLRLGAVHRDTPRPALDQDATEVARRFPHRYSGEGLHHEQDALFAGAAVRLGSWLGAGLSLSLSRVSLSEERRIWAGISDRDGALNPLRDLALTVSGRATAVPGVHAGILVAPLSMPVEAALSVSYSMDATLCGTPELVATTSNAYPAPELTRPESCATWRRPVVARAGVRFVGERFAVEAGGDIALSRSAGMSWTLQGVRVRDDSGATGDLTQVDSLVFERTSGALRVAADMEIIPGFLWISAGYAAQTGASPGGRLSTGFADLAGHTLAVGVEVRRESVTLVAGYGRALGAAVTMDRSDITLISPLEPPAEGSAPVGAGTHDSTADHVAVSVEIVWP